MSPTVKTGVGSHNYEVPVRGCSGNKVREQNEWSCMEPELALVKLKRMVSSVGGDHDG